MGRIWIVLALGLCLLALGCPKPSSSTAGHQKLANWKPGMAEHTQQPGETAEPPEDTPGTSTVPEPDPPATVEDAAETTEIKPAGESATATEQESNPDAEEEPAPIAEGENSQTEQEGKPQAEQEPTGIPPFVGPPAPQAADEVAGESGDGPGLETGDDPKESARDAMDPDAARGSLVNGPPGYDSSQRSSSGGMTGEWQVIAASTGGELRWYEKGDWAMRLNEDSTTVIARKDGAEKWEQHGNWRIEAEALELSLGPGGEHTYQPVGEDANVKALVEEDQQTALFIVRLDSAAAPQLFHTYQTDFGPLSFTSNGPGKWRGSYGDAGGQLDVHLVGPFCIGKWEQGASAGGVILRLSRAGFTGWWWYESSLGFDGRWNGTTGSN